LSVQVQKDKYGETQIRVDQYWPDGSRFRRNFPNRRLAEGVDAEIRVAKSNGTWRELRDRLAKGANARRLTLAEFADRYLEEFCKTHNRAWQRKRDSIKALKEKLGAIEIEALDANHVAKFISWRKEQGRSNGTINRDLSCLKHMLNYAVKLELIKENKVQRVDKLPEILRERTKFTDQQVDHFLACAEPRIRPMFGFLRETGCRLQESMTLKHTQVLRPERLVVFTDNTKSGKPRYVPMTEECERWIDEMVPLAGCPYTFYNPRTRRRWKNCRKVIDRAIVASGLEGFLIKDLRRHYGITLSENGAEMHVVQAMLGHSSVTTTEKHYAHFSPQFAARRALQVLEGRKKPGNNGTQMGRKDLATQVA
jgi:site-specific recombinase XerD